MTTQQSGLNHAGFVPAAVIQLFIVTLQAQDVLTNIACRIIGCIGYSYDYIVAWGRQGGCHMLANVGFQRDC